MRSHVMGIGSPVIVAWILATLCLLQPSETTHAQDRPSPSGLHRLGENSAETNVGDPSRGGGHDAIHDHSNAGSLAPLGFSLTRGWLDPCPHDHFSRGGTPFAHTFFTEPAFIDRGLFVDTRIAKGGDENEVEMEAELEWALTRRIGLAIELPAHFVDPKEGETEEGFGDFAFAPRLLLVETHRLLLSTSFEVQTPTGNERRGLGRGETALSPKLTLWYELGRFLALNAQFGTEHGLESGDVEFLYNTALTFSLVDFTTNAGPDNSDDHFPAGMINLLAEVNGRTGLSGEDHGRATAEVLFGATYLLTSHVEIRAGLQFPLFKPKEFDTAYLLGLVYHF